MQDLDCSHSCCSSSLCSACLCWSTHQVGPKVSNAVCLRHDLSRKTIKQLCGLYPDACTCYQADNAPLRCNACMDLAQLFMNGQGSHAPPAVQEWRDSQR